MPPKLDPYATKLNRRIDIVLLVLIIALFALLARSSAHGQATRIRSEREGDDWWTENAAGFSGQFHFALDSASRATLIQRTNAQNGVDHSLRESMCDASAENILESATRRIWDLRQHTGILPSAALTTFYWDTTAGAGNGVGGSATWTNQTNNLWSTTPTGDATLTNAAATDAGIFQGSAGTITLAGNFTLASWTFNTTDYILTPNNTNARTLTGSFSLSANVNLNIGVATATDDRTLNIAGSIGGNSGSSLTIQGSQTSGNAMRLQLNTPNSTISVPIIVNMSGAGIGGVVATSTGELISGSITNNSTGATILGATTSSDLTVTGKITGTGSVRFQAQNGDAGSGAGTVTIGVIGGQNDYTGASIINMGSGSVKLGVDDALSTVSALQFGATALSGSVGSLDMNGKNQTVASLESITTGTHSITNASATLSTLTIQGSAATTYTGKIGTSSANNIALALSSANTGTLTLTGANTYTGPTIISGGTLLANNTTGSATGTSAVTVNNGGSLLGGTGKITGAVTINANAAILGGSGTTGATQKLTLSNNLTLTSNSIVELALGPSLAHSTLARAGGTWTFASTQKFTFLDLGATTGTYDNIITGLASNPGTEGSWTITNGGWTGTFTYDGGIGSGNIDLTLTAVPEPSGWVTAMLALCTLVVTQRRYFRAIFS